MNHGVVPVLTEQMKRKADMGRTFAIALGQRLGDEVGGLAPADLTKVVYNRKEPSTDADIWLEPVPKPTR